ncbi:EAL domain-containing protein [Alteromonas sp. a30]|uniref:EAL domain-containing protein n=1 Tax=Alteromonas sp. a30 TaxID=2730917 RepID=UPI0022825B5F|nr:EAL domain-containing protein [Alteromonas sp. a30]MCY7296715.1 EAL domain-containing protein [Alteromonas sp. a30]
MNETSQIDLENTYCPVVGIGASAGGLSPLRELVRHIPQDCGLAFIVAQHLSPSHNSLLVELLRKEAKLPVDDVNEVMVIETGRIYVCPPNFHITVSKGHVHPEPIDCDVGPKPSIDKLFLSMAAHQGKNCCGVVLSGSGSDGAQGCRAIRAAGGLTIIQEPETAEYPSMPAAAIALSGADYQMQPHEVGATIEALLQTSHQLDAKRESTENEDDVIAKILAIVSEKGNLDFSRYKVDTLQRQIERRASASQMQGLNQYATFLENNEDEASLLTQSFFISVTNFFRDPEAFETLKTSLQACIESKPKEAEIRIWVPGCATGEEAYSLAMILCELLEPINALERSRIFATDIDEKALDFARKGVYSTAIAKDIDETRLTRFFTSCKEGFRVNKNIRDRVMFSPQNLTNSPPFLKLDLVSCRNVMIYFKRDLQKQLISLFHYVLNPGGLLFLGESESINNSELFKKQGKYRLFKRNDIAKTSHLGTLNRTTLTMPKLRNAGHYGKSECISYRQILRDNLLKTYAPPTALINANFKVQELFGDTQSFFQIGEGSIDLDITKMIREEFRSGLRMLLHRVGEVSESEPCCLSVVCAEDSHTRYKLQVTPINKKDERLFLVSISVEANEIDAVSIVPATDEHASREGEINQLQDELNITKEHLNIVMQDLEATHEELQSLNEEMQASSEELQASNEELATSNEELQATNEELRTVNDELHEKTQELTSVNADLNNIQDASGTGLVVVNRDMLIRTFNSQAVRVLGLTKHDIGRNFTSLRIRVPVSTLMQEMQNVLLDSTQRQFEWEINEYYYRVELKPYENAQGDTDGIVIGLVDITEIERQKRVLKKTNELFNLFIDNPHIVFWVQEPNFGKFTYVSKGFRNVFGLDPQLALRDPRYLLKVMDEKSSAALFKRYSEDKQEGWVQEINIVHPVTGRPHVLKTMSFPIKQDGVTQYVTGLTYDNTSNIAKDVPHSGATLSNLLSTMLQTTLDAMVIIDKKRNIVFANLAMEKLFNKKLSNLVGHSVDRYLNDEEIKSLSLILESDTNQHKNIKRDTTKSSKSKVVEVLLASCQFLNEPDSQAVVVFREEFSQSKAYRKLQLQASVFNATHEGVLLLDAQTRCIAVNPVLMEMLEVEESQVIGKVLDIFPLHPPHHAFNDEISNSLEENGFWNGELHLTAGKDGLVVLEAEVRTMELGGSYSEASYIIMLRNITERHEFETTIQRQANYDPLTGLPNRVLLLDRLNQEVRFARREDASVAVMFIDLDHFKEVNDSMGHEAGDKLLIEVASRVSRLIRNSDTFSRFGGDEFVLLMPNFHRDQAPEKVATNLIKALEEPIIIDGQQIFISASVGIALYPDDGVSSSELLSNCDAAMYDVKKTGRSGFAFHRKNMNVEARQRLQLEVDLREAIEHNCIVPYYQPIIDAETDKVAGCEALARWEHEDLGILGPNDFIPHAENSGLISAITKSMASLATIDLMHFRTVCGANFRVSINLSARNLSRDNIKDIITMDSKGRHLGDVIDPNDADLTGLTFEVTESIFLKSHNNRAFSNIEWLRERGAKIALDDFGTGYSALSYLRTFPIDIIKIDRSFVSEIVNNSTDRAVIKAAIEMAIGIGATVVAEGVETLEQKKLLRQLGVQYLQGYYFGRPMSEDTFSHFLKMSVRQGVENVGT